MAASLRVATFYGLPGNLRERAKLKDKLAEHGSLLKELQAKVQAQSHMMEMMQHMMGESTIADEHKK